MKSRKYRENVSVTWSVVLRAIERQIAHNRGRFDDYSADAIHELSHKTVDNERFDHYTHFALGFCEEVFQWYDALCSLRQFLGMKPKSFKQLDIQKCYEFYRQYSDDLKKSNV